MDADNRVGIAKMAVTRMVGDGMQLKPHVPTVFAVILAFNHYEDTRECIESVLQSDYENLRIMLVDNGSEDGTAQRIRAEFPGVRLVMSDQNVGVPSGYNIGFNDALQSGADYILMLNNDTIIAPDMVSVLVAAAESAPQAGMVVPIILYQNDPQIVWSAGGRHRTLPPTHVIIGQGRPCSEFREPVALEYALGCGLLIHKRAFEKAGLWDPGYFFEFEDLDFSRRVRAAELQILFAPDARMWHKVSKSTLEPGKEALFWRVFGESSVRFYKRHGRPAFLSMPMHVGVLIIRELIKGNARYVKCFWSGVRHAWKQPLMPIPCVGDNSTPFQKQVKAL